MTVRLAAFDRIGGASALFRAYLAADPRLAPFVAHGGLPTDGAIRAAAAARPPETGASAASDPDTLFARRADIAAAVHAQQVRWQGDAPDVSVGTSLERLAHPESLAVVTGQQVSLFGGPLYTPLKALSAVLLARRAEALTGRPVVPVFWMATEDHDADEVNHVQVGETRLRHPFAVPLGMRNHGAAGRLVLGDDIRATVDSACAALPETPFTASVAALLRCAYAPGTALADAFGHLLAGLFTGHGLVLLDADDLAIKRLAAPLLERAATTGGALAASVRAAGERLVSMGFHAQLPDPTAPGLFGLDARGRLAFDLDADRTVVRRGTAERMSVDDFARMVRDTPGEVSPAAWLRPAMQDALLPTLAYVGGPGEIAYWLQLRGVYEALGVPMPLVASRISATFVDDRTRRALERTGAAGLPLSVEDVPGDADALFTGLAHHDASLATAFDAAEAAVGAAIDGLAGPMDAVLPTGLAQSRAAARTRALAAVERLRATARRAERRRQLDLRRDATRVVGMLRPGGGLQERAVSVLSFRALYGPRLLDDLAVELSNALPDIPTDHAVVTL